MLHPRAAQVARGGVAAALRRSSTAAGAKREGDISDAFVSLSGAARAALPARYAQLKRELVRGRERELAASWARLLRRLRDEADVIARGGSGVIPQVEYSELEGATERLGDEIRKRGVVVVGGVIPEGEARAYKDEVEDYVRRNPQTRGACLS